MFRDAYYLPRQTPRFNQKGTTSLLMTDYIYCNQTGLKSILKSRIQQLVTNSYKPERSHGTVQ